MILTCGLKHETYYLCNIALTSPDVSTETKLIIFNINDIGHQLNLKAQP